MKRPTPDVVPRHLDTPAARAGAVYSFGRGRTCALGHGDKALQMSPRRIEALDGFEV